MGIIQRFADIMTANINALLDKAEDPAKMRDRYLRSLQKDLEEVKEETVNAMAEEKRCEREWKECSAEIDRLQVYAEKAVLAGNDEDARLFLTKKVELKEKQTGLQQACEAAAANSAKMRQMYDKLRDDIAALDMGKEAVKTDAMGDREKRKPDVTGRNDLIHKYDTRPSAVVEDEQAVGKQNGKIVEESYE